jgi:anti-sigma B factor antagonist
MNKRSGLMALEVSLDVLGGTALIELMGDLDASSAFRLKEMVELAATREPKRLVLVLKELRYMASAGLRVLIFAKQKLGKEVELILVGAQENVLQTLQLTGIHQSVTLLDELPESLALERRRVPA